MGSAFAEFQENVKGSITPGKLADMVLLSDDIFTIDPAKIRDVTTMTTIVGGRTVWDAGDKKSVDCLSLVSTKLVSTKSRPF